MEQDSRVQLDKTTVMAEFVIRGDDFDPQVITDRLAIIPQKCWMKNADAKPDAIHRAPQNPVRLLDKELKIIEHKMRQLNQEYKSGPVKPPARTFSFWAVETGYQESRGIDEQLVQIYNLLKDKTAILNELKREFNLNYTIGIVPKIENNEKPAFYFEQYIIDFAHAIQATIDIDLYIFS